MTQERLLNFNDVVVRYKFSPHSLRWLIRTRQIPIVRIGKKRIYFDPEDLGRWISKGKVPVQNGG